VNQYSVVEEVTFNRWLTGSPEMPKYKQWATDILTGIQSQFDEQLIWSKTRDWFLLHRGMQESRRENPAKSETTR